MMMSIQIAIDGPAGAGKSTIAKALSERLDIPFLDSGAIYRAVTYYAVKEGIDLNDSSQFTFLDKIDVDIKKQLVYLNGEDVSSFIRTNDMSKNVSVVAAHLPVRQFCTQVQQRIAEKHSVIIDGRDIGTHVLPYADYKFFITADVNTRAKRRLEELEESSVELDQLIEEMTIRDNRDSTRAHTPLKMAQDAVLIDTSNLTIENIIEKMLKIIKK
jgi:cytidylate kinase